MDQDLVALVNALRPAELVLRDWVRPLMDAAVVREIAGLDYGMEVEENRQAIEELLVVKRLPAELLWPPREVLELASYGNPEDRQEHVVRLFATLILIRADDTMQPAATLAGLVESAVELGADATEDAVRYLAWCRLHEPGSWRGDIEARPLLTLGLLLAYLLSPLRKDLAIVTGLTRACVAEAEAALGERQQSWPDQPPAEAFQEMLKDTVGGAAWRTWRALIGRCRPAKQTKTTKPGKTASAIEAAKAIEAIEPLRAWFTAQ